MNKEIVKKIALENGFKLKEQANGSLDLNPYVYVFANKLIEHTGLGQQKNVTQEGSEKAYEAALMDCERYGSDEENEGGLWSWQHHEADRKRVAELEKRLEIATRKWTALTSIATTCPNQLPDEFFKKLDELHDALCGHKVEHESKGTAEA
ncbi:hypothetical protein WKH77_10240 [Acinetobacter baumannii]